MRRPSRSAIDIALAKLPDDLRARVLKPYGHVEAAHTQAVEPMTTEERQKLDRKLRRALKVLKSRLEP